MIEIQELFFSPTIPSMTFPDSAVFKFHRSAVAFSFFRGSLVFKDRVGYCKEWLHKSSGEQINSGQHPI